MKSPYRFIPWIPLLAMWAYMLLCPACSKAPAPTPTPKFEVGQLVQAVVDGSKGQVVQNHESTIGLGEGAYWVRFGPSTCVQMNEFELEPLEKVE
jgi:hypothetical protein